ncbi:MAG: exonuclease SbcCD subunit D [Oscillospiraceae bacterium]|nr:exonuclease SbcCD subunit D [Oscillospiraceae bacterium]
MKLIHLSDLHLGKRLKEFNLLDDQEFILRQCLTVIDEEKPDAVILAGDIYDKAIPSAEAVALFDEFLYDLVLRNLHVLIISGNHDSPERIAFGHRLLKNSNVHVSPVYDGTVRPITLEDRFGSVNLYLLPFIKPIHVRRFFENETIETYTDAIRTAIRNMQVNPAERNVLVTHQFVTGAERSESEEIPIGGLDNVDASVFDGFDYVALGHIHGPQSIGSDRIRYCGTPLKYSFSEAKQNKSVTVAELGEKGRLTVKGVPLIPKREMRELRGSYMELVSKSNYEGTNTDDYIHITLTDEEDIPEVISRFRILYPNLMQLDYDNQRTRNQAAVGGAQDAERKSPTELFSELYEKQNGMPLSEEQRQYTEELMARIWEGGR